MANNPYTTQTISNYNNSPPPDDGTAVGSNQLSWAKHKTKLGDPIKTLSESINSETLGAFAKVINTDADESNTIAGSLAVAKDEKTISTGSVTPTRSFHTIDTEGDTATDILDTIATGSVGDGCYLKLLGENSARVVTLNHTDATSTATTNIVLKNSANKELSSNHPLGFTLIGSKWHEDDSPGVSTPVAIADGGTGATTATGAASNLGVLESALNLSDVGTAATAFTNIKQAATDAATGVVEIATQTEVNTGTDTARSITSATLDGFVNGKTDTVITASDAIVFADADDSDKSKKDTVQGIVDLVPVLNLGTPIAASSVTVVDFTGIAAGTKKITIGFFGISGNGTSDIQIQLGDAGGIESSGYLGGVITAFTASIQTRNFTSGAVVDGSASASTAHGTITLTLENSTNHNWTIEGNLCLSDTTTFSGLAYSKSLSAELTQVRITTVGGTVEFDAGEFNITTE